MKKLTAILMISMLLVIIVSGCQEASTPINNSQARLIGNENLKLKNIIKDKDMEIATLQNKILEFEKKNSALQARTMQAGMGFAEMMTNTNKRAMELQKRNELLKARIKELEN